MNQPNFVHTIWRDFSFGLRMLVKSPVFALTVIMTLGVGIGINSAIFGAVTGVLLRDPPIKQPESVFGITTSSLGKDLDRDPASSGEFAALQQEDKFFAQLAAASYEDLPITAPGQPDRVSIGRVTPNYFDLLGVKPTIGRFFVADQDASIQHPNAIISYDLWRDRWGADPGVIGQSLTLGGEKFVVIGVMPSEFKYATVPCDIWTPESFITQSLNPTQSKKRNLNILARLRSGVSKTEAEAEISTIFQNVQQDNGENSPRGAWVPSLIGLREILVGPNTRRALLLLMFVVAFVLLIACANIAGISLARSATRQNEFAVRLSLGATRYRIIQQLFVENVILAIFSGALGALVSLWGIMFLRARLHYSPSAAWLAGKIEVNGTVLLFTLAISCLTVLVFGLAPGLQSSRPDLQPLMKQSGRTALQSISGSRMQMAIVLGEVAVCMFLLFTTSASIQLIIREMRPQLGFEPEHILTMAVALSGSKYDDPAKQSQFFKNAVEAIQTLPGVQSAAATQDLPESRPSRVPFEIEGQPISDAEDRPRVAKYIVSSDYLSVMRIPLLRGRTFTAKDHRGAPRVVIVNQTFANRFFPTVDPAGARIRIFDDESNMANSCEIVGVVGDVIDYVGQDQSIPQIYLPFLQSSVSTMLLVVRTQGDPLALGTASRNAVWALDKGQPVENIKTMTQVLERKGAADRLLGGLLGAFAAAALCLATLGIYGLISYMVAKRTSEIGVRMALGAQRSDVLKLVISTGVKLTAVGSSLGLLMAILVSRFLIFIRPDSSVRGLLVLAAGPVLLIVTSLLACWVPARRAMKLDPNVALRYE